MAATPITISAKRDSVQFAIGPFAQGKRRYAVVSPDRAFSIISEIAQAVSKVTAAAAKK